jgi:vacuolar protein sorting-associated protein 3
MSSDAQELERRPLDKRRQLELATGPFVLRDLLPDVPLSEDGTGDNIKINCVDYLGAHSPIPCLPHKTSIERPLLTLPWLDNNLYVGTSASELLHFFQVPPDPADKSGASTFILASRLKPAYSEPGTANGSKPGVQQILLLPRVGKACILCNWTVTFYSLPELSPVFGTTQVKNCSWIGGVDLNEVGESVEVRDPNGVAILLSLNRRIQVVRIGDDARVIKVGDTVSHMWMFSAYHAIENRLRG